MLREEFKPGERVEVFNQIGRNWTGWVVSIGKKFACVKSETDGTYKPEACDRISVFTNHRETTRKGRDGFFYLVPFHDLRNT